MFNYKIQNLKDNKKYIYLEIKISLFRFSFYKMKKKFTIRLELSKGWNKSGIHYDKIKKII